MSEGPLFTTGQSLSSAIRPDGEVHRLLPYEQVTERRDVCHARHVSTIATASIREQKAVGVPRMCSYRNVAKY